VSNPQVDYPLRCNYSKNTAIGVSPIYCMSFSC